MKLREAVVRQFQLGHAEGGQHGALIHSGSQLRRVARQRGLRILDISMVCCACGAYANAAPSFVDGFGHWHGCLGADSDIRFIRSS